MLKCILSLAHRWRNMLSALFNKTNIMHMPISVSRRLYPMYIVQELGVCHSNAARPVIYEYWHFTQMHYRIMLLRVKDWIYKTSFTPSLFIEVSAPSKEGERPCICVRDIDLASVYTMCFHDKQAGRPSTLQNITCNYAGRYVVIYNKRHKRKEAILELCEVEVYGKI